MITKQELDGLSQEALGAQTLTSTFMDKQQIKWRYSFYTGGISKSTPEQVCLAHARNVATALASLLTAAGVEYYSCIPVRTVNRPTFKVEVMFPLMSARL